MPRYYVTVTRKTVAQSHISWQGRNNTHPVEGVNILPGSAPALHSVILYPYPSPSSPPYHPITLTPNPGAEPSTRPGCVSICAKTGANTAVSRTFCGETDGAPRCRIPVSETRSGGRDGVWNAGRGRVARSIKKRALDGSKTLKKYYVMPP